MRFSFPLLAIFFSSYVGGNHSITHYIGFPDSPQGLPFRVTKKPYAVLARPHTPSSSHYNAARRATIAASMSEYVLRRQDVFRLSPGSRWTLTQHSTHAGGERDGACLHLYGEGEREANFKRA